jgi:hypothetical protein
VVAELLVEQVNAIDHAALVEELREVLSSI